MSVRGPGAAKVRRTAELANGDAANPFESCLRHVALGVEGLHVRAPDHAARTFRAT